MHLIFYIFWPSFLLVNIDSTKAGLNVTILSMAASSVHLQTTIIMPWYITASYISLPPTLSSQIAVGQYEDLLGWFQLKLCWQETFSLREDNNTKKTFSFKHCPNHQNPPPPDPNSSNLAIFFRTSKFKI